jgi:hypothetical protein
VKRCVGNCSERSRESKANKDERGRGEERQESERYKNLTHTHTRTHSHRWLCGNARKTHSSNVTRMYERGSGQSSPELEGSTYTRNRIVREIQHFQLERVREIRNFLQLVVIQADLSELRPFSVFKLSEQEQKKERKKACTQRHTNKKRGRVREGTPCEKGKREQGEKETLHVSPLN